MLIPLLLGGALTALPQGDRAHVVYIHENGPCDDCRVALTPEVVLGDDDGPGLLTSWASVFARDRGGRFYVHDGIGATGTILVFDSKGRYEKTVGRKGKGPGEYQYIYGISPWPGDSLLVLDAGNQRISVLDSQLTFVRSVLVRIRWRDGARILPMSGGRGVTNGEVPTPSRFGHPFHVVAADGTILSSFGMPQGPITPSRNWDLIRRRIAVVDGRLFAAYMRDFAVEEWSLDGTHLRTFRRDVKWFPAHKDLAALTMEEPPKPWLMDIRFRGPNQLWVLLKVPDADWRSGMEQYDGPDGSGVRARSPELIYDTLVELWDLRTGSVIASARSDQAAYFFLDDTHIVAMRKQEATGVYKNQIIHVHLTTIRP